MEVIVGGPLVVEDSLRRAIRPEAFQKKKAITEQANEFESSISEIETLDSKPC